MRHKLRNDRYEWICYDWGLSWNVEVMWSGDMRNRDATATGNRTVIGDIFKNNIFGL